jgi:hypothetical protein
MPLKVIVNDGIKIESKYSKQEVDTILERFIN